MQTSVKQLKKDDLVAHYDHIFKIEQDAKQVTTTQSGAPVYATTGMCVQGHGNGYMKVGEPWTFQGVERVTVRTITEEIFA
jgi:hypothetical protein